MESAVRFHPVSPRRRKREIRLALAAQKIAAPIGLLSASPMQSVYRVNHLSGPLLMRWRDQRDPVDAVNAEHEILDLLRAAGVLHIPEWKFSASTPRAIVTALSYVAGQRLRGLPSPELMAAIGRAMAGMHEAIRQASLSAGTAWDAPRFRGLWNAARPELDIPEAIADFADRALAKFATAEAAARNVPDLWGVIHSDLNASNIVVADGVPGFIDFAEAGPALFAWDLCTLPLELWWDYGTDAAAACAALFDGYRSADGRGPPTALLRICVEVRLVEALTWMRPGLGEPPERCQQWVRQVVETVGRLKSAPPAWLA